MKKIINILFVAIMLAIFLFLSVVYLTFCTNVFSVNQSEYEPSSINIAQSKRRKRFICEYNVKPHEIHIAGVGRLYIASSWYEYGSPLGVSHQDNEIVIRLDGDKQEEKMALLGKKMEVKMNNAKLKNAISIGTYSRFVLLINESQYKLMEKDTFYMEFWSEESFLDSICFIRKNK